MIGAILPYMAKIRRSYQSNDIIDRLNYHYTATILVLAAVTLAATQYVGKPIQCWVPPQFTGAWEKYAETYCFIKGSYFLPEESDIDESYSLRETPETKVGYYQWVPLVLAFQAFLFYLPSIIWRTFNFNSGINVKSILNNAALVKKKFDKGSRNTQVLKAVNHMVEALEIQKEVKHNSFTDIIFGKNSGYYLVGLYCFTKFLYVINVFLQFVILNAFLGPQYTFWGYGILQDLINGREWEESGHFPRVTMCDFNVRVLGNIHRWSVQCVLMINMFNEKIFIFMWFWFVLVGFITILSLLWWTLATYITTNQRDYIVKYLRCTGTVGDHISPYEMNIVNGFIRKFLRPDGVFLLRLVQTNGGDLLVGEMITELYQRYKQKISDNHSQAVTDSPNSTNL
ncbi:Innexin family-containing protein [Strongyloides ratti]|uniref:Innexin n=1 Tax=Strongyloides ratti TaxID=34506 RepID=A0A090LS22_STRRB|nr:Innexin family-containing protein [Strongyloides ratti]CEF70393.1 Innexin family-containing protein [Strongyloides ratti]